MADKGKKGKAAAAPAPAAEPPPPPPAATPEDKKGQDDKNKKKANLVQPKNEVGTRKGCRRYKWELKNSNIDFWLKGHALVKIMSLGCLIAAMIMFTGTSVHPLLTLIITMELSVFCFFFITYTLAINRYVSFILWPISDLLNDLFAFIFLMGAVFLGVKNRQTMPLNYLIAMVLIGTAGIFALADIGLQTQHFKGKRIKTDVLAPPPKQEQKDQKPMEAGKPPEKAAEKEEKPKGKGKGGKK